LILPYKNKAFYPEEMKGKSRLEVYSTLFSSIEVNSSFYKIPLPTTAQRWADEVSDDFKFTFKVFREITHAKKLDFNAIDVERFMDVVNEVKEKKGCLLVQLPPSMTIAAYYRLEELLELMRSKDENREWNICVEFRHKSWYTDKVYELLEKSGTSIVYHDKIPSGITFDGPENRVFYLRLHGPEGYRSSYDDIFLLEFSEYIQNWLASEKDVYVYFNNTMGNILENIKALTNYVQ
jgi:uncharacterized protein YecE (DUF72 family)